MAAYEVWLIYNDRLNLFWSQEGWGEPWTAAIFTAKEREKAKLPEESRWVLSTDKVVQSRAP